jgi:hypothetical protein
VYSGIGDAAPDGTDPSRRMCRRVVIALNRFVERSRVTKLGAICGDKFEVLILQLMATFLFVRMIFRNLCDYPPRDIGKIYLLIDKIVNAIT